MVLTEELYYWVEETDNVWIKIPSISAGEKKIVTVEKTAGYSPDGTNTFPVFNDFTGTNPFNAGTITSNIYKLKRRNTFDYWSYPYVYMDADLSWTGAGYKVVMSCRRDSSSYTRMYHRFLGDDTGTTYNSRIQTYMSSYNNYFAQYITDAASTVDSDTSAYSFTFSTSFETWETNYDGAGEYTYYRSGVLRGTNNLSTDYPDVFTDCDKFSLLVHGSGDSNYMEYDWIVVTKSTENEPVITVTDKTTYYEIEVDNTSGSALTDYAIKVAATDLGTLTNDQSLKVTTITTLIDNAIFFGGNF